MLRTIFEMYRSSFSGLSKDTWLLSIVLLINRSGYMAVPFMGLYVTQSLHRSPADAGLIISCFGVGAIAGSAAGGKFTDMVGFKLVQVVSAILSGAFFLLFAIVRDFQLLCILSVVISFFSEAFRPANYAATAAYATPGKVTRSYSLNRLATNVGWAFGVSLGGLIASYNYQLLFYVDGLVNIVVGFIILSMLPAMRIKKSSVVDKDAPQLVVQKPWKDGLFVKFILLTTIFAICFFLMFRVVPIFLKEQWKVSEFAIGVILGINGVIIALFEMIMIAYIEHRRTPVYYIVTGTILIGASFLLLTLPVTLPILLSLLSIICFTIGEMFALPFINNFVIGRSNEHNRGQYAGGYSLSWSIASVAGPAAGFFLAERFGYDVLWILLAGLLLLTAWGFRMIGKEIPAI